MMPFSIWVVDDEEVARDGISLALRRNYQISAFPTAEEAIEAMLSDPPTWFSSTSGFPE